MSDDIQSDINGNGIDQVQLEGVWVVRHRLEQVPLVGARRLPLILLSENTQLYFTTNIYITFTFYFICAKIVV